MNNTGWQCLPWAFAKVINHSAAWFMSQIGHDGSSEPYHDFPGVKRGFHQQECIEVLLKLGYSCTPIELVPQIQPSIGGPVRQIWFPGGGTQEQSNKDRFEYHLRGTQGVLTGVVTGDNHEKWVGHAVAWFGTVRLIRDDRKAVPTTYAFEDAGKYNFIPNTYWKVQRIQNV